MVPVGGHHYGAPPESFPPPVVLCSAAADWATIDCVPLHWKTPACTVHLGRAPPGESVTEQPLLPLLLLLQSSLCLSVELCAMCVLSDTLAAAEPECSWTC